MSLFPYCGSQNLTSNSTLEKEQIWASTEGEVACKHH